MDLIKKLTYDIWRRTLPKYVDRHRESIWLECGTGPGHLFGLVAEWFPRKKLFGLDIDLPTVQSARQLTAQAGFLVASAESLPFPDRTVESIISLHMVEHLQEPEKFFQEAARVLQPQGLLVFATPNPTGIGARVMKQRWTGWVDDHISLHAPSEWLKILEGQGFVVLRHGTTGITDIPIFRKLPLALLNWGPLFAFGFFPWRLGGAYICIARLESQE
jgi:ubiquinone/menaquinone biosynthesis C-methylase UbiE